MAGMIQIICLALLYTIPVTQADSGVCSGDKCSDVISMPLLRNDLKATLTADLDVSLMNKYLTDYIKQKIKLGFESAIKELLEKMVDNKTEHAIANIDAFVLNTTERAIKNMDTMMQKQTSESKLEIDAIVEKSKQAIANMEAKLKDVKTEADTYISRKITEFESIFERKDRPKYAFFAYLSSDRSNLPADSVVVFDMVALNIGNSYSGTTGKFYCQEDGVYTFSWTAISNAKKDFTSSLVIDGSVVATNVVDSDSVSDAMTGSSTVVVNLKKGQSVWIKVHDSEGKDIVAIWGSAIHCSVLSGFKIY